MKKNVFIVVSVPQKGFEMNDGGALFVCLSQHTSKPVHHKNALYSLIIRREVGGGCRERGGKLKISRRWTCNFSEAGKKGCVCEALAGLTLQRSQSGLESTFLKKLVVKK